MKINKEELIEKELKNTEDFFVLNNIVLNNMDDLEQYSFNDKEKLDDKILNKMAIAWGYYLNDEIIAANIMFKAREKTISNFELEINHNECIENGAAIVHPKFRGNGLQEYMMNRLVIRAKEMGYKYMLATVHPENIYSLKNSVKVGYKIIAEKDLERGKRKILLKTIV